jgi:hypothetical protein
MPIHIGTEFIVNLKGWILNPVHCIRCRHVYTYVTERSEPGGAFSRFSNDDAQAVARATATAQLALQLALEKSCDPVPCPECGTYQPNMVPHVKYQYRKGLRAAGTRVLLAAGGWFVLIVLAANWLDDWKWIVLAAAVVIGLGLFVVRWCLVWRLDPNSQPDVERRKEIGRQRVAAAAEWISVAGLDVDEQLGPKKSSAAVTMLQVGLATDGQAGAIRSSDRLKEKGNVDRFSEQGPG